MDNLSRHRSGVLVFYWASPRFAVETINQFGPNVVSFQLVAATQRWCIIGCYLAPDDALTIESVVTALRERPRGAKLLVAWTFNMDLAQLEGAEQDEDIAADFAALVLDDISAHFLPRQCP